MRWTSWIGLLVACCIAGGAAAADLEILHTPTMAPGTNTSVAVAVSEDSVALWGRRVSVELAGLVMGSSRTDRHGRAIVAFQVPAHIESGLQVMTVRAAGESRSLKMPVLPSVDVALGVDCWPCAAGEPVALRALVLERLAGIPLAGQTLTIQVTDDRERLLWEGEAQSGEDGLAEVSWLPPAGAVGWFRVEATGDEFTARTEVWLDDGAPEMVVVLDSEAAWVRVDGTAQVRVTARYTDGTPVAGGHVVAVSTSLVRAREVIRQAGSLSLAQDRDRCLRRKLIKRGQADDYGRQQFSLDGEGMGAVEMAPPGYLVTLDVEHHSYLALTATVTDDEGRTGQGVLTIPVSDEELLIRGSWLGWDGQAAQRRLMVSTQYPDGSPAAAEVAGVLATDCWEGSGSADADGLTTFLVPAHCTGELRLTARVGAAGAQWRADVPTAYALGGSDDGDRPFHMALERVMLGPGEALAVELTTPSPGGTAELMLVIEGAPIAWRDVPLEGEHQRILFQIPEAWRGLVTVVARRGTHQTAQQAVIVEQAGVDLQVSRGAVPDGAGEYLEFAAQGAGGASPAAVSVSRPGARLWDDGLARWSGAIPPLAGLPATASLAEPTPADGMEYWLASLDGTRLWPRTTTHRPRPVVQSPQWLVRLTSTVFPWLGRMPSPGRDRFVMAQGAAVALLLAVCWVLRRRPGVGPLALVPGVALLVGLAIWPALPWARGPQTTFGIHGADLDELGPRSMMSRHYPGLTAGMEAAPRFGYQDWLSDSTDVMVQVTRDGVQVNGDTVVTSSDYKIDGTKKRGTMISPLYDELHSIADDHKALAARFPDQPFRGDCLFLVEDGVPFAMLREVMYTAGQAQFADFRLTEMDIMRPVAPQGPGPARHPWLYAALLAAVLVALIGRKSPLPSYLAFGVVALYAVAHGLNKVYPLATEVMSDRGAFPLEEVLLGLHLPVMLVVVGAVAWEAFGARRAPALGLAGLALVVVMLSVLTGRDFRMYWEMPAISESSTGYSASVHPLSGGRAWEPGDGEGLERYLSERWPAPEIPLEHFFPTAWHRAPVIITDADGRGRLRVNPGALADAGFGVVDTAGGWGAAPSPSPHVAWPTLDTTALSDSQALPYQPVRLSRRLPGHRWIGPTAAVRPRGRLVGMAGMGAGLVELIGTTGSGSGGGVADLLADASLSDDLDAALASATGIKVARPGGNRRPGSAAQAPAPPPPVVRITTIIDAELHDDPAAVAAAINSHEKQLASCCMALVSRGQEPVDGDVVLELMLTRSGQVDGVEIQYSDRKNWQLDGCLHRAVKRWQLPPDLDDEFIPVEITLEYRFE